MNDDDLKFSAGDGLQQLIASTTTEAAANNKKKRKLTSKKRFYSKCVSSWDVFLTIKHDG